MVRPNDSPDVKASKALAYILRHGAEKEGLDMRSDGYIRLDDVLARPKMREVDTAMVLRLVAENAKQRFESFYGIDPSPPKPKVKKGQGKGKGKQQGKGRPPPAGGSEAGVEADGDDAPKDAAVQSDRKEVDAAASEDLAKDMGKTAVSTELPLIALPAPNVAADSEGQSAEAPTPSSAPDQGEYFIRATQGHSIKLESVSHLTPVSDDEEGRQRAGECVHGTRWESWETLKTNGLSRMARTHIHLAPASADHPILPRPNSTLRIYIDSPKLLAAGIPSFTSSNGVVLTPGDERGVVEKQYWRLAERKVDGQWVTVWKDGAEVV